MSNIYKYVGEKPEIYTGFGLLIAKKHNRIVHGGRGDYVEFLKEDMIKENIKIPEDQRWRFDSPVAYYIEFRTLDGIKVYFQKKLVDYADYKLERFYISPNFLKNFEKNKK